MYEAQQYKQSMENKWVVPNTGENGLKDSLVIGQKLNANQECSVRDNASLLPGCSQSNMTSQDSELSLHNILLYHTLQTT